MLLAKIKEKLFNRRNTVEVEEIKGDINLDGDIKAKNVVNTYIVSNIKAISGEILSSLKAGDIVQKEDSSGKHSYIVSFKKDGTGICLTYTDASVVETQSYDYTEGHWVYNSEDKTPLIKTIESGTISNILGLDSEGKEVKQTAKDVVMNGVKQASAGTIVDSIGLDANGDVVKGQAGGGTKLYIHKCRIGTTPAYYYYLINDDPTVYTTALQMVNAMVSRHCVCRGELTAQGADTVYEYISWNKYDGATSKHKFAYVDCSTESLIFKEISTNVSLYSDTVTPL